MSSISIHQFRVAAVAKVICDNFKLKIDSKNVILACLYHDMGNIIKFDLNYFPEFTKPEGLEYWQKVKDEYVQKYGHDEHLATEIIAKEIGLPTPAFRYLHEIGFSKLDRTAETQSFEIKICAYADMRVGPHGVISIEERLTDGKKRYAGRKHAIAGDNFEKFAQALRAIEQQIFSNTTIRPEEINDDKISPIFNTF